MSPMSPRADLSAWRNELPPRTLGAGLCATAAGALCDWLQPGVFARLLGPLPAWFVCGVCTVLCTLLARRATLCSPGQAEWDRPLPIPRLLAWTAVFALVVTLLDLAAPFDANINVPLPYSLLFYPALAYVAETLFHVVPLSVVMLLTRDDHSACVRARLRQLGLGCVVLIEPVFQASLAAPGRPTWAEALTFMHIGAINALLVTLVVRRGPFAAFAQRVAYYAYWHVLYGELRLLWLR